MSGEELLLDVGNPDPHLLQQYKVMIQQVGRFIYEAVLVSIHRFNQAFGTLLADFLCYFLHTLDEKLCRVRALRHVLMPPGNNLCKAPCKAF